MSDISVLEGRLQAALDRIGCAIEAAPKAVKAEPVGDDSRVAKLEAQLQELQSSLAEASTAHEAEVSGLSEKLASAQAEVKNLQSTIGTLRGRIRGLRKANTAKVGDAELINKSLEAELEAADAQRREDQGAISAILEELEPLMGEENA